MVFNYFVFDIYIYVPGALEEIQYIEKRITELEMKEKRI